MRLYHNPRCSKSRQALEILNDRGIDFEEYRYLEKGIALEDFDIIMELEDSIRTNDIDTKININDKIVLRKLLQKDPKILQRPILIANGEAIIGRPPELIVTLLPDP